MTPMRRLARRAAVVGVVLAIGLRAGWATAAGSGATFSLTAAQTPANGELNFNGTEKGHLVITVPLGARVTITLSNKGTLPHSLQVIPYTDRLPPTAAPAPAFPGAQTKNPQVGITKGKSETITFIASKAGKYLFICGFPGHALLGMYGTFEVSPSTATKPMMVVEK